jgi:hypothetical protein
VSGQLGGWLTGSAPWLLLDEAGRGVRASLIAAATPLSSTRKTIAKPDYGADMGPASQPDPKAEAHTETPGSRNSPRLEMRRPSSTSCLRLISRPCEP